jgi:hypothetical protein
MEIRNVVAAKRMEENTIERVDFSKSPSHPGII